jgi:predicted O-linked N-acetylglucosamine transferase (SPINDLY family)
MPALRQAPVTFGSFNNANKINATVAALWAEIVNAVPDSRLLLKAKQFKDDEVRAFHRRLFERAGLSADRLELSPWAPGYEEHLAAYRHLDIGLDPFPYNGTATTCEAVWMGVPVVTLAGRAHAGRVGVSLLHAVGLSELSAATAEEYVAKAVRLAEDRPRIAALRSGLRQRMAASELCDRVGFGRAITAALRSFWHEWRGNPAPSRTPPASPSPR